MHDVTVPAQSRLAPIRSPRVVVLSGPDANTIVETGCRRLTIGTADGNDLVLHDETVSRYHLELEPNGDRIKVRDLGSTNGTLLGSSLISEAAVSLGTRLKLGATTILLEDGPELEPTIYPEERFGPLIGRSVEMRSLMATIARVAPTQVSVLVLGETGVGKEVIARAIHEASPRKNGPFETVDCGTLIPALIASELFGHEKGAFTGAERDHAGAFERADGGTLFLDEIGDLPPALQTALLGALERRAFRRVGGTSNIKVDVRVICATNRDLRAHVNANRFRPDLYYRIGVVLLQVPPLRERTADIPPLVQMFLHELGLDGPADILLPAAAWDAIRSHTWPGNVRELRNFIEATFATGRVPKLDPPPCVSEEDPTFMSTPFSALLELPYKDARALLLDDFERAYVEHVIWESDGNVTKAAQKAQMNRSYFSQVVARSRERHGQK